MIGNFNINKELLDAMRIIARQEIEKCNRDITKTGGRDDKSGTGDIPTKQKCVLSGQGVVEGS